MKTSYLITGGTGNVGSEIVSQLLEGNASVRVLTRDPSKAARWAGSVDVLSGDYEDLAAFGRAAEGVAGIFLMNQGPDLKAFTQLLDVIKEHGQPRIVFLSSILAKDPESMIGKAHKDREDAIRESGLRCKFLRPGGFMTNSLQWIGSIKAEGLVQNAMGDGKFPPIAAEDIAAVAVRALTDPDLAGEVFELTGGELITVPEEVRILSEILGKPIRCVDVPIETAVQNLVRLGVPAPAAASVGRSFEAVREGRGIDIRDTVEKVTGKRPMAFRTWARKHASRFV